jgi:hypothetical protein
MQRKSRPGLLALTMVASFLVTVAGAAFAGGPVCPPMGCGPVLTCPPPVCPPPMCCAPPVCPPPMCAPMCAPRCAPPCGPVCRNNPIANLVEGTGRLMACVVAFPFKVVHALVSDRSCRKPCCPPPCPPPTCGPPPSMMPPPFVFGPPMCGPPTCGPVGYGSPMPYRGRRSAAAKATKLAETKAAAAATPAAIELRLAAPNGGFFGAHW